MDILKRSLAPITETAWEEIDNTARDVLKGVLSARRVVDVEGPKGIETAAVSRGRLNISDKSKKGVEFGYHQVQPLVEVRVPFELNIWDLDDISRGAKDPNLGNLEDAAKRIARFEDDVLYHGLDELDIKGLKNGSEQKALTFKGAAENFITTVSSGLMQFKENSIDGPHHLVVGSKLWQHLASYVKGYPLQNHLERLLGGTCFLNPFFEEAFLVSARGGDLRMTLGQDLAIGYKGHDADNVYLYLTESFTFQILEPKAVIAINWASK